MQTDVEAHIAAESAKVLVIDDNPGFLSGVSRILEKSGYEVLTSIDGFSGIARARQELPGLILLVVNMTRKDGFKVMQELGRYRIPRQACWRGNSPFGTHFHRSGCI